MLAKLTPVDIFGRSPRNLALVRLLHRLTLQLRTENVAVGVHRALERITLPAEHVVGMLPVASPPNISIPSDSWGLEYLRITHGVDERLGPIGGPQVAIIELTSIPRHLVEQLRNLDGVTRGARAAGLKGSGGGVSDMGSVVGGVEVLSVPAAVAYQ